LHTLLVGESILKTFTKDNTDGKAFTLFVGTGRGFRGPNTHHFAEIPVAWGIETLQMFLRSANPVMDKVDKVDVMDTIDKEVI